MGVLESDETSLLSLVIELNFVFIRFHRFLDVNSHKIEKTIEG